MDQFVYLLVCYGRNVSQKILGVKNISTKLFSLFKLYCNENMQFKYNSKYQIERETFLSRINKRQSILVDFTSLPSKRNM